MHFSILPSIEVMIVHAFIHFKQLKSVILFCLFLCIIGVLFYLEENQEKKKLGENGDNRYRKACLLVEYQKTMSMTLRGMYGWTGV